MAQRAEQISVKEAAHLLRVSDKTIYRWIRQGVIPTAGFQGQYRFDRGELESWAQYKRIGGPDSKAAAGPAAEEIVDLAAAVRKGGIHYKIEGATPQEIYGNLVEFFSFIPLTDTTRRENLSKTLTEREALASTGVGHGLAIPHPRHPRDLGFGEPVVGIFFLEQPVDFGAFDKEPVFVLFVSLCATVKGHLQMLAQVSHLLHVPETQDYLRTQPNRTDLLNWINHHVPTGSHAGKSKG